MSFKPLTTITSKTLVLPTTNIDTDQIMPAKFLSITTKTGLGEFVFSNLRFDAAGNLTDHALNSAEGKACEILVAGHNFGCGSSREHAPWGLTDYGFRVVISTEIADIFRGNSLKNGLLPIVIDKSAHKWLLDNPGAEITVDLEACEVRLPRNGGTYQFDVDAFSRFCLMNGVDEMGYLNKQAKAIAAFEDKVASTA